MPSTSATIHGVTHSRTAFPVPVGACDCHVHVFGPVARFPYDKTRVYTPGDASIEDLLAHQTALGLSRLVIVHPSPYGIDNRCSIDALHRLGARARGVAVIDPATISDTELKSMHASGMRGARANLSTTGISDPSAAWDILRRLADRVGPLGWHVQTFTAMAVIDALADRLKGLGVTLVVDHFGGARGELGISQQGFASLLSLVAAGQTYVKLSGTYRSSKMADASDMVPLARALIDTNPKRMLWGSDWPHPGGSRHAGTELDSIEPFHPIDDGAALNRLHSWTSSAQELQQILVDNPARLYGF